MDKIQVTNRNRDGSEVWFEHYEGNLYTIHASKEFVLEYCNINFEELPDTSEIYDAIFKITNVAGDEIKEKAKIISFDPSGGPYISVGDIINGYKIERIFYKNGTGPVLFKLNDKH